MFTESLTAALEGFLISGGLIIAIGAQNAYILRMGLQHAYVFTLCLLCSLSDAILIVLGVTGLGAIAAQYPSLIVWITFAGAAFLVVYGFLSLKRALKPSQLIVGGGKVPSYRTAIATVFSFTWLNPHVYLDTFFLVGGISAKYSGDLKVSFAVGAVLASFTWFFCLGYGARLLAPIFEKPKAWRVLDIIITFVMWYIAFTLIYALYQGELSG